MSPAIHFLTEKVAKLIAREAGDSLASVTFCCLIKDCGVRATISRPYSLLVADGRLGIQIQCGVGGPLPSQISIYRTPDGTNQMNHAQNVPLHNHRISVTMVIRVCAQHGVVMGIYIHV